jgi:lipopolysaccharide export system protein LptA
MKTPERYIPYLLVLAGLALSFAYAQEPKPPEPPRQIKEIGQTVTDWSYAHYQGDKLLWEAKGKTAVVNGENDVAVQGLVLTYYQQLAESPQESAPQESEQDSIALSANEGVIRKTDNYAGLKGGIDAQWAKKSKTGETAITNKLTAEELGMDFVSKVISSSDFVSITHWLEQPKSETNPGNGFPKIVIKGKGFNADTNLSSFAFHQLIQVNLNGLNFNPLAFGNLGPAPAGNQPNSAITIVANNSLEAVPASFRQENDSRRITFTGQVVMTQDTTKLYTDHLEILIVRIINPQTKLNEYAMNNTRAYGGVRIESSSPATSSGWSSASHTFIRNDLEGTVIFTGTDNSPANLKTTALNFTARYMCLKPNDGILTLKGGKKVTMDTANGEGGNNSMCITADDDVQVYLNNGRMEFQKNVKMTQDQRGMSGTDTALIGRLESDRLVLFFDPQTNKMRKLRADGSVMVMGIGDSWARGECLEWSPEQGQINIKSNNNVKVWHQQTIIEGAEIIIYTTPGGQWERIKSRPKEGEDGKIKIAPPKSQ